MLPNSQEHKKKLLTKQNQHNGQNSKKGKEELRIINQIEDKLQKNKEINSCA